MHARSRLLAAFGFLAFLSIGSIAVAQEKVQFKIFMPQGTAWTFSDNEEMSMESTLKAAGQTQNATQKMTRKVIGDVEVLTADSNGTPTSVKINFDPGSGGQVTMNGQSQPMNYPLAGKSLTLKVENGQVTHDGAPLDPQTEADLKQMAEQDQSLFPGNPVGVGDSWSIDPAKAAQQWQVDLNKSKLNIKMTLKEFRDVDGRRAAVIDMNADITGSAPMTPGGSDMSFERHMKGNAIIDVATGRTLGGDLNGVMTTSGMQQQQSPNGDIVIMQMDQKGDMKTKTESKFKSPPPVSAQRTGIVTMPPANDNPLGGNPLTAGNGNPLARPAGPAPLSGIYRSDKLVLSFALGGKGVEITFGQQHFTGEVSKWDGKSFNGHFMSAGNMFEFSGSLDGDNMAFSTGGTNYQLKHDAPKNPLAQ